MARPLGSCWDCPPPHGLVGVGVQPLGSWCTHPRRRPTCPACFGSGGCGPCPGTSSVALLGQGSAQIPAPVSVPWPHLANSARNYPSCQFWSCQPELVLAGSPSCSLQVLCHCLLWQALSPCLAAWGWIPGSWHWEPLDRLEARGLDLPQSSLLDSPVSCSFLAFHLWPQAQTIPVCKWGLPLNFPQSSGCLAWVS